MTINHSTTLSQLKATVALIAAIIICMTAQAQQTHGCTSLYGRVIGLMPVTPCDTLAIPIVTRKHHHGHRPGTWHADRRGRIFHARQPQTRQASPHLQLRRDGDSRHDGNPAPARRLSTLRENECRRIVRPTAAVADNARPERQNADDHRQPVLGTIWPQVRHLHE